ncbi:hypothetical protein J0895_18635 [Phormidium pseudopriestleyi FRX01]|uniref:Uncharacterized protein n=1 Tax=Phormidium pseudopriestleyi FRX01 TaxID=1759528 RepID=A0ABS3FV95_9CYAN|nr:hypothetical protein [Phormidium pseudopriestleyi]MBO0351049.1 hypothetical protein [Phormidium pseudopriestleyi FRX01]
MVIRRTINFTSGPLPLARGGLGWGLLMTWRSPRHALTGCDRHYDSPPTDSL